MRICRVPCNIAPQAVNAVVSVLLVGVLYLLGRELFHARVGFWGAMLFQLLPSSGRLLGDGLSEPLFFCGVRWLCGLPLGGLRNDSPRWMAALGVFSGLAYLTRPEGLLIAAVAVLVVVIARRALLRAVIIVLPLLLVAVPYMATIRGVTAKPSAGYFLDPNRLNDKKEAAVLAQPLPFAKWELDWGKGNNPLQAMGLGFRGTLIRRRSGVPPWSGTVRGLGLLADSRPLAARSGLRGLWLAQFAHVGVVLSRRSVQRLSKRTTCHARLSGRYLLDGGRHRRRRPTDAPPDDDGHGVLTDALGHRAGTDGGRPCTPIGPDSAKPASGSRRIRYRATKFSIRMPMRIITRVASSPRGEPI
jgi:hypothetical protein